MKSPGLLPPPLWGRAGVGGAPRRNGANGDMDCAETEGPLRTDPTVAMARTVSVAVRDWTGRPVDAP
jgi:hypothetical protein